MSYHVPVLARASVEALVTDPDGAYVDATFGGGGHARLVLERLSPAGRLLAFDQDPDARREAEGIDDERLLFAAANFRYLGRFVALHGLAPLSGVLADLGVSSRQFDVPERGFSYRYDAPLDMRMAKSGGGRTAADFVAEVGAEELQEVLGAYGEVRNARTLARAIVEARERGRIRTTGDLLGVVDRHVRGQRPRYLSQVFQALRIAVNDEFDALRELLAQCEDVVGPGGRLVVISYHSGEDRLVKNVMRSGRADGRHDADDYGRIRRPWRAVTRKPLEPDAAERADNPRARSARLRVAARQHEPNP